MRLGCVLAASQALPILFYLANSPGRAQQLCCALIPILCVVLCVFTLRDLASLSSHVSCAQR